MKAIYSTLFFSAILMSCGGSTDSSDSHSQDTTAIDTVGEQIVYDEEFEAILAGLEFKLAEGFQFDSAYISVPENPAEIHHLLKGKDVIALTSNMTDCRTTNWKDWTLKEFLKLDSLKEDGKFEDYSSSLDLGMTAASDAYSKEVLILNDSTDLLVWYIDHHTYEACPYGYGTVCFGSLFVNGNFKNTAVIAEYSGGGDPPAWGSTLISAEVKDGAVYQSEINENCDGDMTEDGQDVVNREEFHHVLEIVDGMLKQTETDRKD